MNAVEVEEAVSSLAEEPSNDETLERIYIDRRFKNDTERLETLFSLYSKMTEKEAKQKA